MSDAIISKEDWSLHRKGHLDQVRHKEKVREAVKKNLADIVSEEAIVMSDGKQIIKVPIRSLDEFRFRYDFNKQKQAGQGSGDSSVGDIIASDKSSGKPGKGSGAGEQPGSDYYEADVTIEELAELVFEELSLPNLEQKQAPEIESVTYEFTDIRKKGLMGNIDKKKTILANLKRNALQGVKGIGDFKEEDMRFKVWEEKFKYESNAVVLAMMDTSGSMGPFEKYIARAFFFWMVRFLRTKYKNVNIVFLAHHTEAKEVTEEEFFTKAESGGTRCSSVYKLALELIEQRYNPKEYNIYPFHFSDGDNLSSDNELCLRLVNQLTELCNQFGYGEIVGPYYRHSTLMSVYKKIVNPKFKSVMIRDKNGVYPALKSFFTKEEPQ